jgi:hypothetical protein
VKKKVEKPVPRVPEILRELADLYEERNKVHGDNYLKLGHVLKGYFPNGITLSTVDDFNRYALFTMVVGKMGRYAECMLRGEDHEDSLRDSSVYGAMLLEVDLLIQKAQKEKIAQNKRKASIEVPNFKKEFAQQGG